VFDLDADEEEVDLANDNIFEVVPGTMLAVYRVRGGQEIDLDSLCLVVFELNMQAILDSDLHLDTHVGIRWHSIRMYPDFSLLDHLAYPPGKRHSKVIPIDSQYIEDRPASHDHSPQLHVDACIALVLLLDVLEREVEGLRLSHLASGCQFL
jgi:hypothetical protein